LNAWSAGGPLRRAPQRLPSPGSEIRSFPSSAA